jgi:hypothetical protein
MGLDMGVLVKLPQMDMFGRPISVTPAATGAAYVSRGIWHKDANPFPAEEGSIVTDHVTSIDVLDAEFSVLPRQGDLIDIPADGTVPAEGTFTVLSATGDGGGMTNLILEEYLTTVATPLSGEAAREFVARQRQRGRL